MSALKSHQEPSSAATIQNACQQKPAISTPTSRLVRIWFIRLAISRSFSIGIGILRSFSANPATRQRKLPFNSLGIFIFLSYLYTCVYSFYSLIKFKFEKKKKRREWYVFVYHFTCRKHCSDSQKQKYEAVRQLDTENHNKISL